MTGTKPQSQEQRQAAFAPETHNDEQDDHRMQAQEVAKQARQQSDHVSGPTESAKDDNNSDVMNDSTQDVIDHMRDMESSGRIDMSAYRGEPNHDDNEDELGSQAKVDPELRSDGS